MCMLFIYGIFFMLFMYMFICCIFVFLNICVLVTQLCLTLCDPMDCVDCTQQAPLSMEFSRQEYWSGLPFPSLEALPDAEIKPRSPAW